MRLHLDKNMKVYEMSFERYVEEIKELVENEVGTSIQIEQITTTKNNGTEKAGLMMSEQKSNLKPVIYLNEMYERQKGNENTLEDAVIEFLDCYEKTRREKIDGDFVKWESVKERIAVKLINKEWNRELLEDVPYKEILDLALVFFIIVELGEDEMGSILIRNEHLHMWGIQEQELWSLAMKNSETLLPAKMLTIRGCISELIGEEAMNELFRNEQEEKIPVMYILTNEFKMYGASSIVYPNLLDEVGEIIGADFYVLPSSVHETILVRADETFSKDELTKMVQEVNQQVASEELLSNHAYFYSVEKKELTA